jgi:hypothetical protein
MLVSALMDNEKCTQVVIDFLFVIDMGKKVGAERRRRAWRTRSRVQGGVTEVENGAIRG